jgi:MerR family transcriptional regulator, thiopeptide resistance regulator
MERVNEYTVGDVARLSHVSVRTLHHYDEVGLLPPSARSEAGYRLYSDEDLSRLARILFFRELEFGLDEIAGILANPDAGAGDHLRRQHQLLRERRARIEALLRAIETEMEVRRMGMSLTPEEQFEVFGTDKLGEYDEEAGRRWGDTQAYKESRRRAAAYTKEDWLAMKREADENIAAFRVLMERAEPADGAAAMQLAEAHREHISRWFYRCDHAMHRALGEMYVADPRFTATYDAVAPGLARYVHDAVHANADRAATMET